MMGDLDEVLGGLQIDLSTGTGYNTNSASELTVMKEGVIDFDVNMVTGLTCHMT